MVHKNRGRLDVSAGGGAGPPLPAAPPARCPLLPDALGSTAQDIAACCELQAAARAVRRRAWPAPISLDESTCIPARPVLPSPQDPVITAKYGFLYGSYSERHPQWGELRCRSLLPVETTRMVRKPPDRILALNTDQPTTPFDSCPAAPPSLRQRPRR